MEVGAVCPLASHCRDTKGSMPVAQSGARRFQWDISRSAILSWGGAAAAWDAGLAVSTWRVPG